jgi:hypothetical protein
VEYYFVIKRMTLKMNLNSRHPSLTYATMTTWEAEIERVTV